MDEAIRELGRRPLFSGLLASVLFAWCEGRLALLAHQLGIAFGERQMEADVRMVRYLVGKRLDAGDGRPTMDEFDDSPPPSPKKDIRS